MRLFMNNRLSLSIIVLLLAMLCSSISVAADNITFADANVKAICVANWDTNGDGELSYAEAAAVTYLGEVFQNASEITSFDEFQYFTGLTAIGSNAFMGCTGLTSITIPNSVTSIGSNAFNYNSPWFNNLPEGLNYVGLVAYKYKGTMPSGTSVSIKKGTLGIAGGCFEYCSGLTSVDIPNSVTTIGEYAFSNCSGLASLTIPNSVTSIGMNAFDRTSWFNNLPNGLNYVGLVAYKYKGTMPSGTRISIEEGTQGIAGGCFYRCSGLTSVDIPNSVISIGEYTFRNCSGLTSVDIPNSVTTIGKSAFTDCTGLTSVTIPNSVSVLSNGIFYGCTGLTSVNIPSSVSIIERSAFILCSNLTNVAIPNSVTTIGPMAFWQCGGLTSVTIPNSFTTIGASAFSYCSNLTSINIPASVTSIGEGAFAVCSGMTSMTVDSGNDVYDSREGCNGIIETATNAIISACKNTVIPTTVTAIGNWAFSEISSWTALTFPTRSRLSESTPSVIAQA